MKKLLIIIPLVILLCFTFSCQQGEEVAEEPVVDVEAEKATVKALIDDFGRFWETEDMELFSKVFAHDDDMIVFGTDAAERWVGWEQFNESVQKQFESMENTQNTTRELDIKVHNSGEVAWVSFLMDVKGEAMGEPFSLEGGRFTGVKEKRNGNWVIVQLHVSVPVAGQVIKY
jgi:ketosteroid isomerase-like protein